MRRKKLVGIIITVIIFIVVLGVKIVITGTVSSSSSHYCSCCRATLHKQMIYGLPLPDRVHKEDFTRYYFKNVDPQHEHDWQHNSSYNRSLYHGEEEGCSFRSELVWRLNSDMLQTICESLPSPAKRKQFTDGLNISSRDLDKYELPEWSKDCIALQELNKAYRSNPSRTDWPQILRKHGLYPE